MKTITKGTGQFGPKAKFNVNPATGETIVEDDGLGIERWAINRLGKLLQFLNISRNPSYKGGPAADGHHWALSRVFSPVMVRFISDDGVTVVVSGQTEDDGQRWVHVSVSRHGSDGRAQLASWDDLRRVKKLFLGPETEALMKFPRESEYVNHAEVLHLWQCIDKDVTPDFRSADPRIGGGVLSI